MGYTVRTMDWRYTAWMAWDGSKQRGRWEDCDTQLSRSRNVSFCARELYAHPEHEDMSDFESFELHNLASDAAHKDVMNKLHKQLQAHFDSDQVLVV